MNPNRRSLSRFRFVLRYRYRKSIEVVAIQLAKTLKPHVGRGGQAYLARRWPLFLFFFAFYLATKFPYCVAFEKRRPAEKQHYNINDAPAEKKSEN